MTGGSDKSIGQKIKGIRKAEKLSQEEFADRVGLNPQYLSRIERGRVLPGSDVLNRIAAAYPSHASELSDDADRQRPRPLRYSRNPKPVRLADVLVDRVYLMLGNHTEPAEIQVRYDATPLAIPSQIRPLYTTLVERAARKAKESGYPYYVTPGARLRHVSQENNRQLSTGQEGKGWVLELGPVSWDQYAVLNEQMDFELFQGAHKTIRELFADTDRLFENGPDLRWCKLSNILNVAMMPITTDGYGLIQHRSRKGVSFGGNTFTCGVAENIHRYLDDAFPDNLAHRINPLQTARAAATDVTGPIDIHYIPVGVPSPLLTAVRGVWEEVSEGLYPMLRDTPDRFKFLNVTMALDTFSPHLNGVVELPLTRKEVERHIQESPGKDHSEWTSFHYLPLDASNQLTLEYVSDQARWTIAGLSAFISSISYWRSRH